MTKRKSAFRQKAQRTEKRYSNTDGRTFYMRDQRESKTIEFNSHVPKKSRQSIELVPQSANQEKYIIALTDPETDIVVVSGPAGTGKTYLGVLSAIKDYRAGIIDRIILVRPAISVEGENHGFLPGDLTSKLAPWVKPITDILREYFTSTELEYMIKEEVIEFAPLGMMRGRTFKNCFIILDESQNATPGQLKMLMTRIGEGSKIVITGDTEQTDKLTSDNGLLDLADKLYSIPVKGITTCQFDNRDIRRHRIIGDILNLYS